MVRIYCLTNIFPWNEKLDDKHHIENSQIYSYFDENTLTVFEKIKNAPEMFKSYQLTEINMGYEFIGKSTKKKFFICIYRNDTGWIRIRMLPGTIQFHSISNTVSRFLIASSKLYPNEIEFNIEIIVRCVRNTKTRGCITKEEENCYYDYIKRINNFCGLTDDAFVEIPFCLPNETQSKSLKQKISDISKLVKMVCDQEDKNEINLQENARYIQELKNFRSKIKRVFSHYHDFIRQNTSAKKRNNSSEEIFAKNKYTSINNSTSYKDSFNNDPMVIPISSINGPPKKSISRKIGRPSIYKNEKQRKIGKMQKSKEYNERIKSQREDLKKEIMDIESKHQDLSVYVENLKSKLASTCFENENHAKFRQHFQQLQDLFKKGNENLMKSVHEILPNVNAAEIKNGPKNILIPKNSAIMESQTVNDKKQNLIKRREKQKIAIQRLRERQKMEIQVLQEKKNLLHCLTQIQKEFIELAEGLLSISEPPTENVQIDNDVSKIKNISSKYMSTSAMSDRGKAAITKKLDNSKKANYERILNSDIPICIEVFAFTSLAELTLQNCGITELSHFEMLPTTLSLLNVSYNEIEYISSSISIMENLKELNLASNKRLKEIPWRNLPSNITQLNIEGTSITRIPSDIEKLHQLRTFELGNEDLEYSSWESINKTLQKLLIKKAKKLNNIDFSDKCKLSSILFENVDLKEENSTGFTNLWKNMSKSLKNLHLMNNRISEILWDAFPSSLKVLKIEKQKIDEIGNISHMNELIRLEANFNMIKSISETIGKLQALTIIQLENNLITSLPIGFENLLNLKYLNLKSNRLDHKCENLEENLWKRLPSNISILKLDGNNLCVIPCLLKKFKLDCLTVNSCNLEYICPFFITEGRKNELIFEIRDNAMLQYLPIIPFKIYQPNNKKDETSDLFSLTEINLITDNKSFVNTSRFPTVLGKPIYKFEYCEENDSDICQCCANCGNKTNERIFEQVMMMDINLCVTSNPYSSPFLLQKSFDDENFMEYLHETEEKSHAKKSLFYGPGTWKTMIKARLCSECLSNFKIKTDTSFQEFEILNAEMRRKKDLESLNISEPMESVFYSMPSIDSVYSYQEGGIYSQINPHNYDEDSSPDNQIHSYFDKEIHSQIPMPSYSESEYHSYFEYDFQRYTFADQGQSSSTFFTVSKSNDPTNVLFKNEMPDEANQFHSTSYQQNPEQHNFLQNYSNHISHEYFPNIHTYHPTWSNAYQEQLSSIISNSKVSELNDPTKISFKKIKEEVSEFDSFPSSSRHSNF